MLDTNKLLVIIMTNIFKLIVDNFETTLDTLGIELEVDFGILESGDFSEDEYHILKAKFFFEDLTILLKDLMCDEENYKLSQLDEAFKFNVEVITKELNYKFFEEYDVGDIVLNLILMQSMCAIRRIY